MASPTPDDPRLHGRHGATGILRRPQGRRLLATTGQYSGGFDLYTFASAAGARTARPSMPSTSPRPGPGPRASSRSVASATSRRPIPCTSPVHSREEAGRLGTIGSAVVRYDRWSTGAPVKRWTAAMPTDDERLYPKSMDVAGDHLFTVAVKATAGRPALVSVFSLTDGSLVDTMVPGPEVGGVSGWIDQSHGLRATRCKDGEYRVLVEEDWRGKNLLYRWKPAK